MKSIRTILTAFSPVDVAVIVLALAAAHCSLAHADEYYFAEIRHRSNLDLGWPVNHKPEYWRSGLFAGARYTWGRR